MKISKYRNLEHFLRCQFYQDWLEEYGSEAAACRDYASQVENADIQAVIDDLDNLLKEAASDTDLKEKLTRLGVMVDFPPGGINPSEWLTNIRNILQEEYVSRRSLSGDGTNPFMRFIYSVIKLLPNPTPIDVLTFTFAMEYFSLNRTEVPRAVRGAVLRQQHPLGVLVIQVFLDEKNNIIFKSDHTPYGRRLLATRLDDEFDQWFENHDLLIVNGSKTVIS